MIFPRNFKKNHTAARIHDYDLMKDQNGLMILEDEDDNQNHDEHTMSSSGLIPGNFFLNLNPGLYFFHSFHLQS